MYVCLADVLVDAIVGDKPRARRTSEGAGLAVCGDRTRSLGIDERIVVIHVGEQSGASLHTILTCQAQVGDGRAVLRIVHACPLKRVLQRQSEWSALRLGCEGHLCKTL